MNIKNMAYWHAKNSPAKHVKSDNQAHNEKYHSTDKTNAAHPNYWKDKKSKTEETKDENIRTDKDGKTWRYTGTSSSATIGGGREGRPGKWVLVE